MLMGTGILLGAMVLFLLPAKTHNHSIRELIEEYRPQVSMTGTKDHLIALFKVFKSKNRIEHLMQKDTLTTEDTLEIKQIDKYINRLLHD